MLLQKAHNKILGYLFEHPNESFSVRHIAQSQKLNYRTAHDAISDLEKEGSVLVERLGNRNACKIATTLTPALFALEHQRTQRVLKQKTIRLALNTVYEDPFSCIVLFGSQATHNATKHSDIDICVIADKQLLMKTKRAVARTSLPIQLHAFTPQEFVSLINTRKENVTHHIRNQRIILHGTELFYELA